jgi:2-amino-4-hydroxy-6-hydroxymethyldihydropteridine diphosphokinase
MQRAFVAIGSNADPANNVRRAVHLLKRLTRMAGISTVYLTEPEGPPGQPPYYNFVVEVETDLAPLDMKFQLLRPIETALGRVRTGDAFAARPIDLDLILYDEVIMNTADLTLPDPQIFRRSFVAIPLAELAPELIPPGTSTTIARVAAAMETRGMTPLPDLSNLLKRELGSGCQT